METAVSLMAINVFLANAPRSMVVVLGSISGRIPSEDIAFKFIDEFVIWGCSLGLLALIWSGANWARWLNLILAIGNLGLMAVRTVRLDLYHDLVLVFPVAYVVLETVAQYLLFLSPGRAWFMRGDPPYAT